MELDLFHPVLDRLKGLSFVDCVGEYNSHGSAVVCLSDGFEPFLSGGVPDLKSYFMFAYGDGFDLEVDSNGG